MGVSHFKCISSTSVFYYELELYEITGKSLGHPVKKAVLCFLQSSLTAPGKDFLQIMAVTGIPFSHPLRVLIVFTDSILFCWFIYSFPPSMSYSETEISDVRIKTLQKIIGDVDIFLKKSQTSPKSLTMHSFPSPVCQIIRIMLPVALSQWCLSFSSSHIALFRVFLLLNYPFPLPASIPLHKVTYVGRLGCFLRQLWCSCHRYYCAGFVCVSFEFILILTKESTFTQEECLCLLQQDPTRLSPGCRSHPVFSPAMSVDALCSTSFPAFAVSLLSWFGWVGFYLLTDVQQHLTGLSLCNLFMTYCMKHLFLHLFI